MTDTKNFWTSKINWTQILAIAAMLLSLAGFELSPEDQAAIAAAIVAVQGVVTIAIRTFLTEKRIG